MNGKHKGSEFERKVCKRLSKWILADQVVFWRSASSGARSTQLAKKGEKASKTGGDIVALGEEGDWLTKSFSVECKTYKDFSFDLLMEDKGKIPGWWSQCWMDSIRDEKHPMMIFKKNRSPIYLAISPEVNSAFMSDYDSLIYLHYGHPQSIKSMVIYIFEDWLDTVDFEAFKDFCNNGISITT